jgi:hypothetical protein
MQTIYTTIQKNSGQDLFPIYSCGGVRIVSLFFLFFKFLLQFSAAVAITTTTAVLEDLLLPCWKCIPWELSQTCKHLFLKQAAAKSKNDVCHARNDVRKKFDRTSAVCGMFERSKAKQFSPPLTFE